MCACLDICESARSIAEQRQHLQPRRCSKPEYGGSILWPRPRLRIRYIRCRAIKEAQLFSSDGDRYKGFLLQVDRCEHLQVFFPPCLAGRRRGGRASLGVIQNSFGTSCMDLLWTQPRKILYPPAVWYQGLVAQRAMQGKYFSKLIQNFPFLSFHLHVDIWNLSSLILVLVFRPCCLIGSLADLNRLG